LIKFGITHACPVLVPEQLGHLLVVAEVLKPAAHELPDEIKKIAGVLRYPGIEARRQSQNTPL
jgi:hypothetical protein